MDGLIGSIFLFAGDFVPNDCVECDGQTLPVADNAPLASVLEYEYGGVEGKTIQVPNLASLAPQGMKYVMLVNGFYPQSGGDSAPVDHVFTELDDTNFDEYISENRLVLILFYGNWSGPSKMMMFTLRGVAEQFRDRIQFAKYDIDRSQNIAARYGIRAVPTMMILRDGNATDIKMGFHDAVPTTSWLRTHAG